MAVGVSTAHSTLSQGAQPRVWWALIAITAIGLLLRVGAALGDLSIDEVWTLHILDWFVQSDERAAILVVAGHDNIHPLNTGFMAAVRALWDGEPPAIAYRSLSILAGTATVVLTACLGLRGGRLEGILATLVVALSYPLIHYSAEARGYAVMLAAAVASLWALERWLESDAFPSNLDVVRAGSSTRFERVEAFPHWGLSGQSWALYRALP